ncbi:apoptosis-associated speck-like protein containing a CARD [Erinaceus europaeus]|uniref:Apoptosis-associated speck-like protein containing a CARD n=1 Tax=Erinaceus europaeus TaxID=9365 RepID=A0ABM3VXP7_ERIEU|nr:apoptosis-associated speck-like protein containing a CARD [Erinaceus europaeus]
MADPRDAILDALENLTADELRKFKLKLQSVPLPAGFGRIPRGALQPMDAVDLTDKLVSFYTARRGAELTAQVLRDMGLRELAEQLGGAVHPGPADAAAAAPAALGAPPRTAAAPGPHFVDKHRAALIARVTCVDAVLDALYGQVLSDGQYQEVRAASTSQEKMRTLFSFSPAWNRACKDLLLQALREAQPYLLEDLECQ